MPWGIAVGVVQAATSLVFWWRDSATVYALGLIVIAAIYVSVALHRHFRRRNHRLPRLLVIGFVGHGLKDLWQHLSHFVSITRWWPPFCLVVDWIVAPIIVVEIIAGMHFR